MRSSRIRSSLLLLPLLAAGAATAQESPFELERTLTPSTGIDRRVQAKLEQLGIEPARLSSDAVFLRRAHLDVIGTLPTLEEVSAFLDDESPDKRAALVDALLERDEFADYQALRWCDVLRVKAEFPINLWPNAVQAYHHWIRTAVAENLPYDRFVRELLTASGSNFRVPPVNFYRALQGDTPEAFAGVVALTFMGSRLDSWPEEQQADLARFFSRIGFKKTGEWKEEIVYFDLDSEAQAKDAKKKKGKKPAKGFVALTFPDGTTIEAPVTTDPREVFADWLITPDNPWLARAVVNRVWFWLQGRGIVHEPDDLRPDNPPSNPALLAYLAQELVDSGWDLKHLYRLILTSETYQLSSIPRSDHPEAEACFAYYPVRRLDAEVLIDALCQITGTNEEYSSPIPEPFTFIPEDARSIELADGSITSSFLELFGRPPRDTGLESERNNHSTATQRLHLLNSSHVRDKILAGKKLQNLLKRAKEPRKAVTAAYLTILSRPPTRLELGAIADYMKSDDAKGAQGAEDVVWALFNSAEFLYRH